ncbi:MAG TPA: condensation domain-containing protein [Candidatus Limnocylindrales bacterium]|nr:condensation domain-containing protein [Candidatus Limnocylindrales bacterium]
MTDMDAQRKALAALLLERRAKAEGRIGPASFAQQRLWIIDRLVPASAEYNVAIALRITAPLHEDALRAAVSAVVRRHESLRTVFTATDTAPMQRIQPAGSPGNEVAFDRRDLSTHPDPDNAALAWARELAAVPFDLATGPLLRAHLAVLGPSDYLLVLVTHHIVCDGWSAGILCRDLDRFYTAYRGGDPVDATPLAFQYLEYAVHERRQLQGELLEREVGYWRQELSGLPGVLRLPTDRPRPVARKVRGAVHPVEMPEELLRRLRALAAQEGTTVFAPLLGGFHELLARYTGQSDVNVGVPVAGRTTGQVADVVGFFVNTLVLRGRRSAHASLRQLIARTRDTVTGAFSHQNVPFEKLVADLRPDRDNSVSPFFQVVFNYQAVEAERAHLPGMSAHIVPLDNGTVRFDIEVNLFGQGDAVSGSWNYNAELFDAATIEQMAGHYERLLTLACAEPDRPLRELAMVTADTPSVASVDPQPELCQRFRRIVDAHPDATAITVDDRRCSYRELAATVDAYAAQIASVGAGPIALLLDRSPELAAAQLAALLLHVPFVVVDPAAAPGQISEVLDLVGAKAIVKSGADSPLATVKSTSSAADPDGVAYLCVDTEPLDPVVAAVSHRALTARVAWLTRRYPQLPGTVVAQQAPPAGDPVRDLLWPLSWGAHVRIVKHIPDDTGVLTTTPAQLAMLLTQPVPLPCLRLVLCGGEPMGGWLARSFANRYPLAQLHAHWWSLQTGDVLALGPAPRDRLGLVGVGHPAPGTSVHILDDSGTPVPRGVVGRLHLSGAQAPAIPDTGQLARVGPDGVVEVLGPPESLGEIRGVRVEATEVEDILAGAAGIAAAWAVFDAGRITAYLMPDAAVAGEAAQQLLAEVATHARRLLPRDLVPRQLILIDHLPLRRDGQLDRDALPVLTPIAVADTTSRPRGQVEERVAVVWRKVLGRDDISADEDFFHAGGHSLLAIQVIDGLRRSMGVELPVSMLFRYRTIADLAERLSELRAGRVAVTGDRSCLVRIQSGDTLPSLALVHPSGGSVFCYAGLATALPDRTVDAFEAQSPPTDLPAMAAQYVAELEQAGGPIPVFAGWSLGGVVAYEMARQHAERTGHKPPVVLIDSYLHGVGNSGDIGSDRWLVTGFVADLCAQAGVPSPTGTYDSVVDAVHEAGLLSDLDPAAVQKRFAIYCGNMLALLRYRPGPYAGPVHLIRAGDLTSPEPQWRSVCPLASVHTLPGDHHAILRGANVPVLARILERILSAAGNEA